MSAPGHSSPFSTAARKGDLWWQFTLRAFEIRHRGSSLGIIWSVLNPLLMLGLYMVVFGWFMGGHFGVLRDETPMDFALAMFMGIIMFQVCAETMGIGPTLIVSNANLVKKVVFPLEILPLAQLGAIWFHLLISLALLLSGAVLFGRGLNLSGLIWLPIVLGPLLLISVGLAWLLSALGVFFRDVGQVMPFLTQIVLWASAIVYPISRIQTQPLGWAILRWNPILEIVRLARDAVLWNVAVDLRILAYTYAVGFAVAASGRWVFTRLQPAFADVI